MGQNIKQEIFAHFVKGICGSEILNVDSFNGYKLGVKIWKCF